MVLLFFHSTSENVHFKGVRYDSGKLEFGKPEVDFPGHNFGISCSMRAFWYKKLSITMSVGREIGQGALGAV